MKEIWTKKLKEALIWLCGYVNFIAYALVGGYVIVKSNDEDLKKTTKTVFIVTLIFMAISALLSIYNYCGSFADGYYGSVAYDIYSIATKVVEIVRIGVYAVFIIMALAKKEKSTTTDQPEQTEEKAD